MSSPDAARHEQAAIFAALGDDTRLWLVETLRDGRPRSIATLSGGTTLTRQAVTKHLHALRDAGLVVGARAGRETRFTLEREALDHARAYLDHVSAQWESALDRLERFVEDDG